MSLQLWFPFDGNLDNKGLLNTLTPSANVTYGEGKIGAKSLKSSTKVSYDISAGNISTHKFSFSFWAKSDNYTGTSTLWWQLCSFNCSDGTNFHIYCVPNARYKIEYKPELNNYCDTSIWHHLTYVMDGTKLTIYTDGIQTAQKIVTNENRTISSISFGVSTVCINDFRLYDHILSKHEIERDYCSLLIHYPLRDPYIENTINLLENGRFSSFSKLTMDIVSYQKINGIDTLTTGSNVTTGSIRTTIPLDKLTNNISYTLTYKWRLVSGSGSFKVGDWCDNQNVIRKKEYFNGEYWENEIYLPARETYTSVYRFIDFNSVGANSVYEIWDVQLEAKDHSTGFAIGERNNAIIYDCSGRGFDSVERGELISVVDSIRNSNCIYFTSNNAIKIPSPYGVTTTALNDFSVAMWINLINAQSSYKTIFTTNYGKNASGNSGWISLNTEGKTLWLYNGQYHGVGSANYPANEWHHIVVTYKNGMAQWYMDGEKIGEPISDTLGYINAYEYFSLGDAYLGTQWGGAPFEGMISDFRFYGTAIPASAIKDLYKNSATIDHQGNIHAFEFKEM